MDQFGIHVQTGRIYELNQLTRKPESIGVYRNFGSGVFSGETLITHDWSSSTMGRTPKLELLAKGFVSGKPENVLPSTMIENATAYDGQTSPSCSFEELLNAANTIHIGRGQESWFLAAREQYPSPKGAQIQVYGIQDAAAWIQKLDAKDAAVAREFPEYWNAR
ncbi:MAG: hypothetical protein OXR66_03585 [Candidatus Woesearchaeota archaeon]|nr:hypothetical protein [Candidatus Woesearchaeota archaeon]